MAEMTSSQIQALRGDIGDYTFPLILSTAQLQTCWDRAVSKEPAARVYALFTIVARFTRDRDPRLKDYQALLETWQAQANMTSGEMEVGIIDLGLIDDLEPGEEWVYGTEWRAGYF